MSDQCNSPVDLQAHYLCLITRAVEAAGGFCMIRPELPGSGAIYVSRSDTETKAEYVIVFGFNEQAVKIGVEFMDSRPPIRFARDYVSGIDDFFPLFAKALRANRLEGPRTPGGAFSADRKIVGAL